VSAGDILQLGCYQDSGVSQNVNRDAAFLAARYLHN